MPTDIQIRVRYAETDQMGVVYHSNYIIYFEIGRTEAMRQAGITYAELEKRGYALAVIETLCRHKGSAKYDDELTVRTWLREVSKTRMRFEYEVRRHDALLATGHTVLAFLGLNQGMKPVRCPPEVEELARKALEPAE
jgi:acyl-CoA thioester hydrolase